MSYLNQACRDAGAGRDDGLETAVVHHEVTNCNERKKMRELQKLGEGKISARLIALNRRALPAKQCTL